NIGSVSFFSLFFFKSGVVNKLCILGHELFFILSSFFVAQNLNDRCIFAGGILRGSRRERLLSKFVENECEKIDRLMELYMRYSDRVKAETERMEQIQLDDFEMDEDEKYNRKLESGLYTLQLIAVILGHLWCSEHPQMRSRIELLLKQNRLGKNDIKDILQEYHDNIGDLDGPEEKERAQAKIQKFISAL
ncbi:beta-catenin-like protein 1, partial [Neltuma alba]|uniref:beta-catenin-like protein 1 n=1 Tax=Neltuma alba TaxID=207710 RepID=UPI0010A45F02